jgi:hypothetical protein
MVRHTMTAASAMRSGRGRREDDLPAGASFLDVAQRRRRFAQRIAPVDDGLHLPCVQQLAEDGQLVVGECARAAAEDLVAGTAKSTPSRIALGSRRPIFMRRRM